MAQPAPVDPKVAVVAVHGIAYHEPYSTARMVMDLLLRHGGYRTVNETTLRIPVERICVSHEPDLAQFTAALDRPSALGRFDERSHFLAACQSARAHMAIAGDTTADISHNYMRELLDNYPADAARGVYETIRLETLRPAHNGPQAADVHVYEMYWSDLSRLGTGLTKIASEFYQLLFHISQLGRQTVDFAAAEHAQKQTSANKPWKVFAFFHRMAVRLLTLAVPILNLVLAALLCLVFVATLPSQVIGVAASAIPLAALIGTLGLFLRRRPPAYALWLGAPFALTLAYLAVWDIWHRSSGGISAILPAYRLLTIELSIIAAVAIGWVVRQYDRARPGASLFALGLLPFIASALGISVLQSANSAHGFVTALATAAEIVYAGLVATWMLFLFLTSLSCLGSVVVYCSAGHASRSQRALVTALATLVIPASLFLLVTLVLYAALCRTIVATVDTTGLYQPTWLGTVFLRLDSPITFQDIVNRLLVRSGTSTFALFLACLVLMVLVLVWCFFPAVLSDLQPRQITMQRAPALGRWLNFGYRGLAVVVILALIAMPVIVTAGVIADYAFESAPEIGPTPSKSLLFWLGALVTGGTLTLLGFRGRLSGLALGFRPALDAILDIDNYLREFPRDATPRARIFSRYASLLRYLCRYQDPNDGRGYDKIVIVAHSQGTVISADLLRFLRLNDDPALDRLFGVGIHQPLDLRLFTLGCPLRQLYGWRFPHLYDWAYHAANAGPRHFGAQDLPDAQKPDPSALLGVTEWLNAYCSGDYVGRHLWRNDYCDYLWTDQVSTDANALRRERCVGDGAHIHYFDDSETVFSELNQLI